MTPDKINTAIAEAYGWRELEEISDHCGTYGWWGIPPNRDTEIPIPNYHGDLNAMHEAEESLGSYIPNSLKYLQVLKEVSPVPERATAAQRAEAFLRTIGKWEDEK